MPKNTVYGINKGIKMATVYIAIVSINLVEATVAFNKLEFLNTQERIFPRANVVKDINETTQLLFRIRYFG